MSTVNREDLLSVLNQVKPALSAQAFVPVLSHICFDGDIVTAYNDVQAIEVSFETGLQCAIPGDLLIRMLSSTVATDIEFKQDGGEVSIAAGKSRIKFATLPLEDFIFKPPSGAPEFSIKVTGDFLLGLKKTLVSVGSDPTHPAQMGITLSEEEGGVVMYSTDNYTISKYQLKDCRAPKGLKGGHCILPAFFCEQLVSLASEYKDLPVVLDFYRGGVAAQIGSHVLLFSKQVLDVEPMDFDNIVMRYVDQSIDSPIIIPSNFDNALKRGLLVLSNEPDKITKAVCDGKTMHLTTKTAMGEVKDRINFNDDLGEYDFHLDPELVLRGTAICERILPLEKVLVMTAGDQFLHLVAHCVS